MSTTAAEPGSKRKRARKACIPCHKRKRKCDAQYPAACVAVPGATTVDTPTTTACPWPSMSAPMAEVTWRASLMQSYIPTESTAHRQRLPPVSPEASSTSASQDTLGHQLPWHFHIFWARLSAPIGLPRCGRLPTTSVSAQKRHLVLTACSGDSSRRRTSASSQMYIFRYCPLSATYWIRESTPSGVGTITTKALAAFPLLPWPLV